MLEKDTKTVSVERALPLPKWPWEALNRFRAQQAREKLAAGAGYTDTGYVLVDELGLALNTRTCGSTPTGSWRSWDCAACGQSRRG